jgi:DNA-binding transcriptional regulator YiaG
MPNLAAILRAEIARVARKEVRAEVEALKKASAQHRSALAALRREVSDLTKRLRRLSRNIARAEPRPAVADVEHPRRRFSAQRLAAHRRKVDLSAAAYGSLIGVTGQTIYKWEQGKGRPRVSQMEAIAAVRALGKREAHSRVEASA